MLSVLADAVAGNDLDDEFSVVVNDGDSQDEEGALFL